jgi:4-amino-4-deoxy-L-arabinose transferase-like glycosyltransferase
MVLVRRVPGVALALVALALVVRLGFIAATPGYVPAHDDRDYDRLACGLVIGDGYVRAGPTTPADACGKHTNGEPTAFRPPGLPMFLAAVYAVTEPLGVERWSAARVAIAFVGTVGVALLGLVAFGLFGRRTAWIAMGVAAVFPPMVVLGGSLLSETLFVTLMLAAIACVLADRAAGGSRRWLIAGGVICGLAALTRSNAPALLLPLMIAVAMTGADTRPLRARLGRAVALAAIAALIVAPWTLRNALALDGFAPVTTEAGSALAGTYNDVTRTDPKWPGAWRPPARLEELQPVLDPVRRDEPAEQRALMRRSTRYMADHPGYVAQVGARNVWRMLGLAGPDWWQFSGRTLSLPRWTATVSGIAFLVVLAFAVGGVFTRAARRAPPWLWLMPALMLLSVMFVVGETRFRAPVDPFIVLLAALALERLSRAVARSG